MLINKKIEKLEGRTTLNHMREEAYIPYTSRGKHPLTTREKGFTFSIHLGGYIP